MSKPTGGQAFPGKRTVSSSVTGQNREFNDGGMSLRDYFAAQALTGLCGNEAILKAMAASTDKSGVCAGANAIMAYEIADAMLAERSKDRAP